MLNNKNEVFVGKRRDNPSIHWQMPQGGVDGKETLIDAAKRELFEETGIKKVKIIFYLLMRPDLTMQLNLF